MIDGNDMQLAMRLYIGLGGVAILLWLLLFQGMRWGVAKLWLIFAAIAFLFAPVEHADVAGLWVPANTAAVLSWIGNGLDAALPALIALGLGQLIALLLAIVVGALLRQAKPKTSESASPASVGAATKTSRSDPELGVELAGSAASNTAD